MPDADRFAEPPGQDRTGPPPPKDQLSTALAAAAQAGKQAYDQGADAQGDIAADDAGGSKLAQEISGEQALPKPPDAASD